MIGGQESTILYNKVYSDAACVLASITNAQEATATTPTLQCDLYQYDAGQSAFVIREDLSDRETVFAEGATQDVTFNFNDMEKDVLYAVALHRDYKAGGEDRTMEAAPEDTMVYFKIAGCDLTMAETDNRGNRLLRPLEQGQVFGTGGHDPGLALRPDTRDWHRQPAAGSEPEHTVLS